MDANEKTLTNSQSENPAVDPVVAESAKTAEASKGAPAGKRINGRFAPGSSGNPGGKKKYVGRGSQKIDDIAQEENRKRLLYGRDLLKQSAPEAIELLLRLMRDEKTKVNIRADIAQTIADRAYGKAAQPLIGEEGAPAIKIVLDDSIKDFAE